MSEIAAIASFWAKDKLQKIYQRSAISDKIGLHTFLKKLLDILARTSGKKDFSIHLSVSENESIIKERNLLNDEGLEEVLEDSLTVDNNVIFVNLAGQQLITELEVCLDHYSDRPEFEEEFEKLPPYELQIFVEGKRLSFVLPNGMCVSIIDNVSSKMTKDRDADSVHIEEYEKLINGHHKKQLIAGKSSFEIWHKKSAYDFVLRSSPEKNFRKSLALYLESKLNASCLVLEECLVDNSEDKCDVTVITYPDRKKYYFEVKVLGKVRGKNEEYIYNENRAYEGLHQVNTYAINDEDCICGVLVVYDASNPPKEIKFPDSLIDKLIDKVKESMFLLLDPISASKKAKEFVAKEKKKKKSL